MKDQTFWFDMQEKRTIAKEYLWFLLCLVAGIGILVFILAMNDNLESLLPLIFLKRDESWLAWLIIIAPYPIYLLITAVMWIIKTRRSPK
jgi:hypothetical protein